MTDNEVINELAQKILEKFELPMDYSKILAKKTFDQMLAHGGDPRDNVELDSVLNVVVRSWIEMMKEKGE